MVSLQVASSFFFRLTWYVFPSLCFKQYDDSSWQIQPQSNGSIDVLPFIHFKSWPICFHNHSQVCALMPYYHNSWRINDANRTLCYRRFVMYKDASFLTIGPVQMCFPRGRSSLSSKGGRKGLNKNTLRVSLETDDRYKLLWKNTFFIFPFHTWMASTFLWTLPNPTSSPINVLCNVSLLAVLAQWTWQAWCQPLP